MRITRQLSSFTLTDQSKATLFYTIEETKLDEPTMSELDQLVKAVPRPYHDYLDVFSETKAQALPPHREYDLKIDLKDEATPPFGPLYSMAAAESTALKEYLDDMLAKGYIRPSTSPAAAPILFVKKKDGSLRLYVDYRRLNQITIKNRYPLPLIDSLLDQLAPAKIFTKIDLRSAYNLVRVAEGHEWKTAFRTRHGLFEYLVMPFGLTNAPSVFQRVINDVLRQEIDNFCVAYLDDILIYSQDEVSPIQHVRTVLQRLQDAGLYGNAAKYEFHLPQTEYLGFIVGKNGISMAQNKVGTVLKWPQSANIKAVQSFLGFAKLYRRSIKNYLAITKPLTALTQKDKIFKMDSPAVQAFKLLKQAFATAPIVKHFDQTRALILETDASDYAIGAVLSQPGNDNFPHPIAFAWRTMNDAERNYPIHDKEMLAIVWSFGQWRQYELSSTTTVQVYTDHRSLEYFMTSKVLNRRQARWAEFLSEFNFVVTYRPGKQAIKPDALSRRDNVYPSSTGGDAYAVNNPYNVRPLLQQEKLFMMNAHQEDPSLQDRPAHFLDDLANAQQRDKKLLPKIEEIESGLVDEDYSLQAGTLHYRQLLCVPDDNAIQLCIVKSRHDSPTAGHPGRTKTIALICQNYH
ncbi:hypothetical protein ACM66B_000152 [Microbotryomycetes sp. NB124-2]